MLSKQRILVASAAGLFIGLNPWLQAVFYGKDSPLSCTMQAAKYMGQACFPLMTITLGANLASSSAKDERSLQQQDPKGNPLGALSSREMIIVSAGRLVAVPIANMAVVVMARNAGLVPPSDVVLLFVVLMQGCMPGGMMLAICAQSVSDASGRTMSKVLLCQYLVSVVTMTAFLAGFLRLARTWAAGEAGGLGEAGA